MSLRIRVYPVLLLHKNQVYKTINFKNHIYVGDPLNAVRIFNEKKVDELLVLDIDATINKTPPNIELIKKISRECEMPLTYGGGVQSLEIAEKIIEAGVEKIAIGNYAIGNEDFVNKLCAIIGSQSVAGVVNFAKSVLDSEYYIYSTADMNLTQLLAIHHTQNLIGQGVGELILNSVDKDGTMSGYDNYFLKKIVHSSECAVSILGGAGKFEDLTDVIREVNTRVGLAAGSLFTFRGKYKSVLFSYLSEDERNELSKLDFS